MSAPGYDRRRHKIGPYVWSDKLHMIADAYHSLQLAADMRFACDADHTRDSRCVMMMACVCFWRAFKVENAKWLSLILVQPLKVSHNKRLSTWQMSKQHFYQLRNCQEVQCHGLNHIKVSINCIAAVSHNTGIDNNDIKKHFNILP